MFNYTTNNDGTITTTMNNNFTTATASTITTTGAYPSWSASPSYSVLPDFSPCCIPPERIPNERTIDLLVDGITSTLNREVSDKKQIANNALLTSLREDLAYKELTALHIKEFKTENSTPRLFSRAKTELNNIRIKAMEVLVEAIPNAYIYEYMSVCSMKSTYERTKRDSYYDGIKDSPYRDQVRALIMQLPDYATTSFQDLLDLTRKTFM